jgi:hypothetical protein
MITLKEKPRDIEEEYQQIKKRILEGVDEVIEVDAGERYTSQQPTSE